MKQSKYNFLFAHKGKKYAFNAVTGALAEVSSDFSYLLNNIFSAKEETLNEKNKNLLNLMKKGGYILEDDVDELSLLKLKNYSDKFLLNRFDLTIAPTLSCNFACPYCYETPQKGLIGERVKNAIYSQVELAAKSNKEISIIWYGGEPTLAKDIICEMSRKMIDICEKYSVPYTAMMSSNGYLIDDNFVDQMLEYKITSVQITLDGPKEVHDMSRKLKNGQGTFDILIANAKLMKKRGIKVCFRANITKSNKDSFELLLKDLVKNNLQSCNVLPSKVVPYKYDCFVEDNDCLDCKEWALKIVEYRKLLYKYGVLDLKYPYILRKNMSHCSADDTNSFVVDPEGYLYKCPSDLGYLPKSIGNIINFENKKIQCNNEVYTNYILWSPFDHQECLDCNVLPFCVGGCPKIGLLNKRPDCFYLKYNLLDILKMLIDRQISN